jgi:hypothetical protein
MGPPQHRRTYFAACPKRGGHDIMFKLSFKIDERGKDPGHTRTSAYEIARILREVANAAEQGTGGGAVRDLNGNIIGSWAIGVH